jgi:hypothetical protein
MIQILIRSIKAKRFNSFVGLVYEFLEGKPEYLEFPRGIMVRSMVRRQTQESLQYSTEFGVRGCGTRFLSVLMCHSFSI